MANEKKRAVKRSNTSFKDLSKVLENHGRHSMLSFFSFLPISVLRILDTEANKFYDRNNQLYDAALLTRCYTQQPGHLSAALQIGFSFGFWTHSLEMDEWSGFSWFKPGM